MIGLILSSQKKDKPTRLIQAPIILLVSFIGLFFIYLVPLPPDVWSSLKGRDIVLEGYTLLNTPLPWLPISLHPERTFLALFDFIPVVAVGLITVLSQNKRELAFAKHTLVIAVLLSAFLGLVQLMDGTKTFNLYERTNVKRPVGFFSNTNHFACFMAMIIPISLSMFWKKNDTGSKSLGSTIEKFIGGVTFIVAGSGILMSGSSAGYLMLLISLSLSILILNSSSLKKDLGLTVACTIVLLIIFVDFGVFSGEIWQIFSKFTNTGATSRTAIYQTSLEFRGEFGLLGIGPGAFENIYKMYEDSISISSLYVSNVHNDYIQIWLEFGFLGLLLCISFVIWYLINLTFWLKEKGFKSKIGKVYLLSIAMPAMHSLVDYPLRTISICTVSIFVVALLYRTKRDLNA